MPSLTRAQALAKTEEVSDRFEARRVCRAEIEKMKAISPPLPEGHRVPEGRRRIMFGDGQAHPKNCECPECTLQAAKKHGPLRSIARILLAQASLREPALVALECGHEATAVGQNVRKRVRCLQCRAEPPPRVREYRTIKPKKTLVRAERQDDGSINLVRYPAPERKPRPATPKPRAPRDVTQGTEETILDGDRCGGRARLPNGRRCPGCVACKT